MNKPISPVNLFYCYARADQALCQELDIHFAALKRSGLIRCWSDQMISPGSEREQEIIRQLTTAQIILLLVSPDFIASYHCYEKEMKHALKRHETGNAHVIPIILRYADWKSAPFSNLQVLPTNELPIEDWSGHDKYFANVVTGIRKVVNKIIAQPGSDENDRSPHPEPIEEIASSSRSTPSTGKYNIHANEIKAVVLGDNIGTIHHSS